MESYNYPHGFQGYPEKRNALNHCDNFDGWQLPYQSNSVHQLQDAPQCMGLQRLPTYTSNFPIQHTQTPLRSPYPISHQQDYQFNSQPLRPNTSYIVNGPSSGWDCPPSVPQNFPMQSEFQAQEFHRYSQQPQSQTQEFVQQEFIPFESNTENALVVNKGQPQQEQNFCDITEYLNMPQTKAAKLLGIPTSTLSKRWKEAAPTRKWPWRTTCKIDKEVASILQDVPPNADLPLSSRNKLALLLRQRQEELRPVVIRF